MSDMDKAEMIHRGELLEICDRVLSTVSRSDYTTEELEDLAAILEPVGQRCLTEFDEGEFEDEAEDAP